MSSRKQLRKEAALVRGRIDRRAYFIHQRIDSLLHQTHALACSPAALPVAFVCGFLVERLHEPGIKYGYGLLAGLASQMSTIQIVSSLISSPEVR